MPKETSSILKPLARVQNSVAKRLLWRQHLEEAKAELDRLKKELPTTEMMLTIPYLFRGKGHYRSLELKQNLMELLPFVERLQQQPLNRVCEIGTFKGGTLFIWCQIAAPEAHIYSIDLPGGQFGGGYNERSLPLFQSFCKPGQRLECIRGSSHEPAIRDQFQQLLRGAQLDFLFIDGDHSYAGVKQDYEFYSPMVRPGGIIGFHDIHHRPRQPDIEVHKFWAELKTRHRHEEFIEQTDDRRKIGIGLIYKE